MNPDEILALGDRICAFLISCGGAYKELTGELQGNVFYSLGSGQYVIGITGGKIVYFASYWRVRPEDVEGVMERIKPLELSTGSVMYVSEVGNKAGKRGMAEIVKRLRAQAKGLKGLFWHRVAKQDRVYYFPSQQGEEV
jgi:hypothetical protein